MASKMMKMHHVAVPCDSEEHALVFFQNLLGLNLEKQFMIETELATRIFEIPHSVGVLVFSNQSMRIEVFLTPKSHRYREYTHLCLEIPDIPVFINRCKTVGLKPYTVKKGEKTLFFIRDFSENLYELKGKIK